MGTGRVLYHSGVSIPLPVFIRLARLITSPFLTSSTPSHFLFVKFSRNPYAVSPTATMFSPAQPGKGLAGSARSPGIRSRALEAAAPGHHLLQHVRVCVCSSCCTYNVISSQRDSRSSQKCWSSRKIRKQTFQTRLWVRHTLPTPTLQYRHARARAFLSCGRLPRRSCGPISIVVTLHSLNS